MIAHDALPPHQALCVRASRLASADAAETATSSAALADRIIESGSALGPGHYAALLRMVRRPRVEAASAARELPRLMAEAKQPRMLALHEVAEHCASAAARGLVLCTSAVWGGAANFAFEANGLSGSGYARGGSRKSASGWPAWLLGMCITCRSKMMPIAALPAAEAELHAAAQCAQGMMYIMRVLMCLGLKVKLPMILEVGNKGAAGHCSNWSVGGRTRHVEVKQNFLRELKELGFLKVKWKNGSDMTSDLFTKNLALGLFEKHGSKFYGKDQCYAERAGGKSGDSIAGKAEARDDELAAYYYGAWKDIIGGSPGMGRMPEPHNEGQNDPK